MITVSAEWLRSRWDDLESAGSIQVPLSNWDDSDAFTLVELGPLPSRNQVLGQVILDARVAPLAGVVISLKPAQRESAHAVNRFVAPDGRAYVAFGVRTDGRHSSDLAVEIVELASALAERRTALLESTLLSDSCALVVGLGTGGIAVALELAKAGVGRLLLMDGDRLTVGNVTRHHAGLSHVGRRKAYVARDLIREKNPAANVEVYPVAAEASTEATVRQAMRASEVVISAVDGRPSKLFLNALCIAEDRPAIYGGAFQRAYGGQILRVRPRRSPCYQCFVMAIPESDTDFEVASNADAQEIAYSDQRAPIEPGLSLDVAPISLMVARLALNELLIGKPSALRVLERDLAAPWYLWLNRPEPGTKYASLPPLSECVEEMTILRWYGINFPRDSACPVCGDFISAVKEKYGLKDSSTALPTMPAKSLGLPEGD